MWNFRKILISFVLLFVFFVSNSYSEVVKKVKVEGNERISTETIIVFGDIVLGKNYELSDVNVLIKKLYETTFFSNVSVEIENNQLSIIVEENPIINSIIFKGEKAKKYTEKIKELSSLREKSSFIEIWTSQIANISRKKLNNGDRDFSPCNVCDVHGTLIGEKHSKTWEKYYEKKL